jgi:hypothetical protein
LKRPIFFHICNFAFCIAILQTLATGSPKEFRYSEDGIGPIFIVADVKIDGPEAVLTASARNSSGGPIRRLRLCVAAENRRKGCDWELWTTASWEAGQELKWAPLKRTARTGLDKVFVSVMKFDTGERSKIDVYLSAPTRDGFFDTGKDIQDSIKEIGKRLKHTKGIQLVNSSDEADVSLTVVARGMGKAFGERNSIYENYFVSTAAASGVPIPDNTYSLSAVMHVGVYKKEFSLGYSNHDIAEDLRKWIFVNAAQLRERRTPK